MQLEPSSPSATSSPAGPETQAGTSPKNAALGVSVVIPAYNYGKYLAPAIESALAQPVEPMEIIVVDDGSTDNTAEVVARFGERVRYVFQKNAGLSAARNTGIREARQPLIAFLDADDQFAPGMLQRALAAYASLPEDYAIVSGLVSYVDSDGKPLPPIRNLDTVARDITVADLLMKNRFSPSTVVARKTVFATCGGFDTTLTSSEDRDMWLRIASRHRVHRLAHVQSLIRKHTANMSRHASRMKSNMTRVLEKSRAAQLLGAAPPGIWLRVRSYHYYQCSLLLHSERRRWEALQDLIRSALLWPWFPNPEGLDQPSLFRMRTLVRILLRPLPVKSS